MSITLTNKDRSLLSLIARGEASSGGDPYTSVYPNTKEPKLTSLTLAEAQQYQRSRISMGFPSSAIGRYQFIQATLSDCIGYLGVDPNSVKFSPSIQDALIIARLNEVRGYQTWLSSPLDNKETLYANTATFMLNLAREFASIPVPYRVNRGSRVIQKGQSYYANDGLNSAHHDPDRFFQNLLSIIRLESSDVVEIDFDSEENIAYDTEGRSILAQITKDVGAGGVTNPGISGEYTLPDVPSGSPYSYGVIAPNNTRYDFRTGKKVG